MANTLAGTRRLFTNETVLRAWVNLPTANNWYEDRRFFAALNYILDNSYTHSLMDDSYPIAITAATFTAGVHHLDLYDDSTGHTRMIFKADYDLGKIKLMDSTVPRKLRALWTESFMDTSGLEKLSEGGFLKFRWAEKISGQWSLRSRTQMPGYSMQQYSAEFTDAEGYFYRKILSAIGMTSDPEQQIRDVIDKLKSRLEARVQIVSDGFLYCQQNDCSQGSAGFEAWSTPHRDQVIGDLARFLIILKDENAEAEQIYKDFILSKWSVEDRIVEYADLLYNFTYGLFSWDPRDPPLRRWGLD
jgi:hypothetical protein